MNAINETTQTIEFETPPADNEPVKIEYSGRFSTGKDETKKEFKPNRAQRRTFMQRLRHTPVAQKMRRIQRAAKTAEVKCPRCGLFYFVPQGWPPILRMAVRCRCKTEKPVKRYV